MTYGLAFDAIYNFMADLAEAFPESSASKYYTVIQNIKVSDKDEQAKHVKLFSAFCVANRAEILENRPLSFKMNKIYFDDDKDPFDIHEIFTHKDFEDNSADILKHLLTISAIVDEESNAKQILISMEKTNFFKDSSIVNLFGKITKDIENQDIKADPMKTIEGILKTDAFGELVSSLTTKVQNGEIDLSNLLSVVSGANLTQNLPVNKH